MRQHLGSCGRPDNDADRLRPVTAADRHPTETPDPEARPVRRTLIALPAAAALLLTLGACSSGDEEPDPTASGDPAAAVDVCDVPGGDIVDQVDVTGELGAVPTLDYETGLATDETQRRLVVEGDGEEVPEGGTADVALTIINAASGQQLDQVGYDGDPVPLSSNPAGTLPGLAKSIGCVPVGSRVVTVVAPEDALGDQGAEQLGIAPGDSLIFVVDVLSIAPTRADGVDQEPQPGFPTVELDDDGRPTVTIPEDLEEPADLQLEVLKLGDGPVVADGDTVTLQYHGVRFDTGEVFDESWPNGPTSFATTQVVPGFSAALVGQTVGSQVVAVIPPALAYGEEESPDNPLSGQTLVFVIDILDTSAAAG